MPSGKITTMQDGEDIIAGTLFLGTGGGGSAEIGYKLIEDALKEGLTLSWVDVDEIPDDAMTCTPFGMGSIAPITPKTLEEIEKTGAKDVYGELAMVEAVKELGKYFGKTIGAIVPAEPGAANLPAPLVVGARLGIPVVDGDYAGRCIPDEMQGTPFINGKNSWPATSVDKWGNACVLTHVQNGYLFERIGKMLAVAAFGNTAMAGTPLPANEMKQILVRGTLTLCLEIGRAIRAAKQQGADLVEAALQVVGGWRLFEGVISAKEWEDRDGYMFGVNTIQGTGQFAGHTFKAWFKNENHVSWLDDKVYVCSPDLVSLVDPQSGLGISNSKTKEGDRVVAVGMKGLEVFRTAYGLDHASGPRYFGFDLEYTPIEELMKG